MVAHLSRIGKWGGGYRKGSIYFQDRPWLYRYTGILTCIYIYTCHGSGWSWYLLNRDHFLPPPSPPLPPLPQKNKKNKNKTGYGVCSTHRRIGLTRPLFGQRGEQNPSHWYYTDKQSTPLCTYKRYLKIILLCEPIFWYRHGADRWDPCNVCLFDTTNGNGSVSVWGIGFTNVQT